jgi:serine/threonine protein kinase
MEDEEMRPFYARVRNDLTAAWRLLGDLHVVNYLAITTTTRQVASGTVVLPEYFIMEEEGENLHKWLEQHPPCAENRAAFEGYVRCILQGLAALHSAGITHRDVKPKNVVICRHDSSMAKIIDLGLAKPEIGFRDKAVNSMTGATPWFMAPEFMDPHRASQAVDVWAVGVMCAEWLLEEQVGREEAPHCSIGCGMGPTARRLCTLGCGRPPLPRVHLNRCLSRWPALRCNRMQRRGRRRSTWLPPQRLQRYLWRGSAHPSIYGWGKWATCYATVSGTLRTTLIGVSSPASCREPSRCATYRP